MTRDSQPATLMATEIERKFLVNSDYYKQLGSFEYYQQAYISLHNNISIRVRIASGRGYLTLKKGDSEIRRLEFEYEIPLPDAKVLLEDFSEFSVIEKKRYKIHYEDNLWEVDEFLGDNEGLVVAELELLSENQKYEKPSWIGEEVTGVDKYYNISLVKCPYKSWAIE